LFFIVPSPFRRTRKGAKAEKVCTHNDCALPCPASGPTTKNDGADRAARDPAVFFNSLVASEQ
jgi:hypothetical protein